MKLCDEYREQGVRLAPTAYGLGVFALREFCVHEALGPIEGKLFLGDAYESDYCMQLGETGCLEPDVPFRFLNHSCEPNCRLLEFDVEHEDGTSHAELELEVEATIAPGEQLTIDYGWPADHAIPCRCGSASCRGWIVAAEELQHVDTEDNS